MRKVILTLIIMFCATLVMSQTTIKTTSIEYKFDYDNFYTIKTNTVTITPLPTVEIFKSNQIYHNTPINISPSGNVILNPHTLNNPSPVSTWGIIQNSYNQGVRSNVTTPKYKYIESMINKK